MSEKEDLRERYRELLEELRTVLPGVQVLFAFLLTVPFNDRFRAVDGVGRVLFTISLIAVAGAAIVFVSPAAFHRVMPRARRDERVAAGAVMMVTGMVLLALAMSSAIVLVGRFLHGGVWVGWLLGAAIAAGAVLLWFVLPYVRSKR